MKLIYWNAEKEFGPGHKNFGDDLNKVLWDQHLKGCFDENDNVLFYGIGTILTPSIPPSPRKIIMGSGARGGQSIPIDQTYDIRFVRGPRTAAMLGNSVEYITDPAILVATLPNTARTEAYKFGYMPHVRQHVVIGSILQKVCSQRGVLYISPDADPQHVLEQMLQVGTMICEAMHGAIVSDSLNIPWIPVFTRQRPHSFKWQDWSESIELTYNPVSMRDCSGPLRKFGINGASANYLTRLSFSHALDKVLRRPEPVLSKVSVRTRKINQIMDKLHDFKKSYAGGAATKQ